MNFLNVFQQAYLPAGISSSKKFLIGAGALSSRTQNDDLRPTASNKNPTPLFNPLESKSPPRPRILIGAPGLHLNGSLIFSN
jgi:hypothetical protein